jgi:hypothetical protein
MVVLTECGSGGLSAEREMEIWQEIRAQQGEPGSMPGRIAVRAHREGFDAIVWLDDARLEQAERILAPRAAFNVRTLLEEHRRGLAEADKAGVSIRHDGVDPDIILNLLTDGCRLMVAVVVAAADNKVNLHWLLIRQESGNLWVMDPANGQNACASQDEFRHLLLNQCFTGVAVTILPRQRTV